MKNKHSRSQFHSGFTLIELLVVIAIIGLLASVVFASLNSSRVKARDVVRRSDLKQLQNALELYASNNNGSYPPASGWVNSSQGANWISGLAPTYIPAMPSDPSGGTCGFGGGTRVYYYISNSTGYKLVACAENAVPAGDGMADPVRPSWGLQICTLTTCGST